MRTPALRRVALVGGVAVATLALASCSTDTTGGAGDGDTLTIVSATTEPEEAVIALFEEENPDIDVELVTAPAATYSQVVATQLAGGTASDLIRAYPGNGSNLSVVQATDRGFFADLSDLGGADDLPDSLRPVLESTDGALSAVPMTTSAIGGVYNITAMDGLGLTVPTTWSEVLDYCADATAAGVIPYGLGLRDAWTGQFVPYALSATLLPEDIAQAQSDGGTNFSDSAWVETFDKYEEMKDAGCFTPQPNGTSYANVSEQVIAGSTTGWITLSSAVGEVLAAAPSGTEVEFTAFPATDDAEATKLSNGIGAIFALNAASPRQESARLFLEFLMTPEAQAAYSEAGNTSPALDAAGSFDGDPVSTLIADYTSQERVSAWPDQTWPNPNVQQALFDGVQGLFAETQSVDDVLTSMDDAYAG